MRLIRVLALATLPLFLSSCASVPAARTCGLLGGGSDYAAEAGGSAAGGAVLGGVLAGTAAYYACNAFAALDPEDLPPPVPPSPDRRVPTPSPRMPDAIGDIPGDPGKPPPAPPEPAPWKAPEPTEMPPMPSPPAPVAPPLQPKLPPQIAPVPEAPTLPPEPTPVPPIEPVAPIPEPPLPPEPEPEPVPEPEPAPPPPIEPVKEKIVLRGVNFDFDRAEIRGDAAVILDEAVQILNRNPDRQVVIEGHTDWTGPEEYNQQLSESRAEAVKKYMIEQDVEEARLSVVGYGESQPVAPNDTRDGRNRNRRVELKVLE